MYIGQGLIESSSRVSMVTDLASSEPWKFTVEGNVMVSLVDADFFRDWSVPTLLSRDVDSLFHKGTPDSASCTAA